MLVLDYYSELIRLLEIPRSMGVKCDVIIMIIFLSAYKSGHILQAPKQLPTLHMNVHLMLFNLQMFGSKTCHCSTQKLDMWSVVDGDSAWHELFALQLPEGPVHVRQRSSPDALFPMMNGNNSSERGFSARDNVKKKSFDDTSAIPRAIHYSKTQKNSLVNTYDLKQSLNCFLVLFQGVK